MSTVIELAPTPRRLIPRMPGRGDLLIEVHGDQIRLRADQVEQLAGIPTWSTGETLLEDHWELIDEHPAYLLEDAIARCETAATDTATAFVTWLREQLEALFDGDVLDHAQHVPSFVGSYPVRAAANILDADPAIHIGQNGLFHHMHAIGWIDRVADDWQITKLARRNGWLTIRTVSIPAATRTRQRPYPQIYVTPAGVEQLRNTLHALNRNGDDHPHEPAALFD